MPTGTLLVDLRIPTSHTLKDKRAVVRHLLDSARQRWRVAADEVGSLDLVQRGTLAFAAVGRDVTQVEDVLDEVERFVWSHPEVEVVACEREWSEAS